METNYVYRNIADDLRAAISIGKYAPDEMIPSENTLAVQYNTSRVTVRKALHILENEGMIRPQHGKGYFVLSPEYNRFEIDFVDKPSGGGSQYLEINVVPADEELAHHLGANAGTMLVVIRRMLFSDGTPSAYDEKFFPYVKGEPLIERELHYAQFPDVFTDKYVPRGIWTNMEIGAVSAPPAVCAALGAQTGEKLLCVSRTVYSSGNQPIGFGRRWYAPEKGILTAVSNRTPETR
ncbi:MAG: GntR family transcriptional regulator [Clostridia bacterium]|nr:GntR family transcriptional regulator [Clostridia bacterium]